ncbi:hypothetical protein [Streptomyces cyaneofuscatus]|uniref:hypothetical protein n=1 Tax=Streptomyces cyaneofuscatus TaxID=66883 RepID=UPI0036D98E1D
MTDHTAREAAIQAVKDHPSTTFMAPYESLADAVLTSATPLLRAETLREEAANLRRVEREDTPEGALGTRTGLLRAALILDERIDQQAGRPVHPRRAEAAKEHQAQPPMPGITSEEAGANVTAAVPVIAAAGLSAESPETTHQGPHPDHGGLTTHIGTRDTCSAPDCGLRDPEDEIRDAVLDLEAHLDEPELTKDPWLSMCHGDRLVHAGPDHENHPPIRVVDEPMSNGANADYIALMHPGVGRLLANLLHEIAEDSGPELDNRQTIHQAAHKLATTINNRPQ